MTMYNESEKKMYKELTVQEGDQTSYMPWWTYEYINKTHLKNRLSYVNADISCDEI